MAAGQQERGLATVNALAAIPPFPPIAAKLLQLVSDEDVHLNRLVELIRSDPGFTSEVLQLANSPLHALLRQVDSLQQALVVIGLEGLKRMVVTVSSRAYAKRVLNKPELHRCWRHMLACGLLSEEIARACSVQTDQAYTAGLMHDAGRLGLLVTFPDEYASLLRDADRAGGAEDTSFLLDRERETFGIDHCEAGHELAEKWGLPETIGLIAGRHHDRHYGAEFALLDVVALGCRLADSLGFNVIHTNSPWSFDQVREQLPEKARSRFWADPNALREAISERLEGLDPGHTHLDQSIECGPPVASSKAPERTSRRAADHSEIEGIGTRNQVERVEQGAESPERGPVAAGMGTGRSVSDAFVDAGMAPADGSKQRGEINWGPIIAAATALLALLLLLWWDPLR